MASVVRFTLPEARTLYVSGVGVFVAGVFDVDVNDIAQIERVRYRVQPYGAVEVGIVDETTPAPPLPAVPVAPPVDPYPQYLIPSELLDGDGRVLDSRIPDRLSEVALRAAFGAVIVVHGTDPTLARPAVDVPVIWYGTVPPDYSDATKNDVYQPVQSAN